MIDTVVAVIAVLGGFALGYAFRGWYVRRHPSLRQQKETPL
jgi:hypothetical protein